MAQPLFMGNVDFTLYFGTPYDMENIPFLTSMIERDATKTISVEGQVVWQSDFLTVLKFNIDNYNDIRGCQYVKIKDARRGYWYNALNHNMINNKCVQLAVYYDPILTLGVNNINSIHGDLKRWSVSDDAHYNYIHTPEPLNQTEDFDYTYATIDPLTHDGRNVLVGFPYNMSNKPNILEYENEDGELTGIYYPEMHSIGSGSATRFHAMIVPNDGFESTVQDGCKYYDWRSVNASTAVDNYDYAVGLGYDLVTSSFILPKSSVFSYVLDSEGDGSIGDLRTTPKTFDTGLAVQNSNYHNNKANDMGIYFDLYNQMTGDSLRVDSENLKTTGTAKVIVGGSPYCTGCFTAKFSNYFNDSVGSTGLVKSAGWQPYTLSSQSGFNVQTNLLNNTLAVNDIQVEARADVASGVARIAGGAVGFLGAGAVASTATGVGAGIGAALGVGAAVASLVATTATYFDKNVKIRENKMQELRVNGTLGQNTPPAIKFAQSSIISDRSYIFGVRKTSISARDRQHADEFFTAYGYNVGQRFLNSPSMLNTRTRFTYVMADNVHILGYSEYMDAVTEKIIAERFALGLRIWQVTPNYDWTINNPIRS